MKRIHYFLSVFFVVAVFSAQGQTGIYFEKLVHDFAVIEEGVQAEYEFTFTNIGTEPLELSSVKASCGCTTPNYTKEPVMPGEMGKIKVRYNSVGRKGFFNKSITVNSNAGKSEMLYIRGLVEPKEEAVEYAKKELAIAPKIKVNAKEINLGTIEKGKQVKGSFVLKNEGKSDLKVSRVIMGCMCLQVQDVEREIKPGASSEFTFFYTPGHEGNLEEVMTVYSNDLVQSKLAIKLKSEVKSSLAPANMLKQGGAVGF